jgi:hypothetical protein
MMHLIELGEADGCPDENMYIVLTGEGGAEALLAPLIDEYNRAEPEPDNRSALDFANWLRNTGKLPDYDYTFVTVKMGETPFKGKFYGPRPTP